MHPKVPSRAPGPLTSRHSVRVDSTEPLPVFRYHPDPAATGSVESSSARCRCCGEVRGTIYSGPVYATERLKRELCLWCIADGSAAAKFDAGFTGVGWGVPDDVPAEVLTEVAKRTPGFVGTQQERWRYHCGDGGAFLGRVGYQELRHLPDALDDLRREHVEFGWSDGDIESYVQNLHVDGDATAYLFRCLHCSAHVAYSDFS